MPLLQNLLQPTEVHQLASGRPVLLGGHPIGPDVTTGPHAIPKPADLSAASLTRYGVDYAWGTPDLQCFKSSGITFANRYLSGGGSKDLLSSERSHLWSLGIDVGVVFETTAGRSGAGRAAGEHDARVAQEELTARGLPKDSPVFFAVDFDASPGAVEAYFDGVKRVLGLDRVGVYGSYAVVEALHATRRATYLWQTIAWSHGRVSTLAHIYQHLPRQICGIDADPNYGRASGDIGVRGPRFQPLKKVKYASRTIKKGDSGTDVKEYQHYLNAVGAKTKLPKVKEDGVNGGATLALRHDVTWNLGAPRKDVKEEISRHLLLKYVKYPDKRPLTWKATSKLRRPKRGK